MNFDEWWDGLCISGLLIPSHPDKASAALAWTHQQARIEALQAVVDAAKPLSESVDYYDNYGELTEANDRVKAAIKEVESE